MGLGGHEALSVLLFMDSWSTVQSVLGAGSPIVMHPGSGLATSINATPLIQVLNNIFCLDANKIIFRTLSEN